MLWMDTNSRKTRNASISIQITAMYSYTYTSPAGNTDRQLMEVDCRFLRVPFGRLNCTKVGRDNVSLRCRLSKLERRMRSLMDQEDMSSTPREP